MQKRPDITIEAGRLEHPIEIYAIEQTPSYNGSGQAVPKLVARSWASILPHTSFETGANMQRNDEERYVECEIRWKPWLTTAHVIVFRTKNQPMQIYAIEGIKPMAMKKRRTVLELRMRSDLDTFNLA